MPNAIPSEFVGTPAAPPSTGGGAAYYYKTRDARTYSLRLLSAVVAPVTMDEFKKQIRVELTETYEDDLLMMMLTDATAIVQEAADITAQTTATYRLTMQGFPPLDYRDPMGSHIYLPRPPLNSIQALRYYDPDDSLLPFSEYTVNTDGSYISLKQGSSWPATSPYRTDSVQVEYVCYGNSYARRAILLLASHYFKTREDATERSMQNIPFGVDRLIEQLRPGDEFTYPDR